MQHVLPRLARALRHAGVRVSTSEEMDAATAIGVLGMPDRSTVRTALRATLVKDPRDLPVFERLFAAFFDAPAGLDAEGSEFSLAADALDGVAREVALALASGDANALEALLAEAMESIDLPLRYSFQRGLFTHRLLERLEAERLRRALASATPAVPRGQPAQPGQGGGLSAGAAKSNTGGAGGEPDPLSPLLAAIDRYVSRALAKNDARQPGGAERTGMMGTFDLSEEETAAISRAAAVLARRLREQTARRKRRAKRGRIDVHATLRGSLATAGVPFAPRWKRVHPDRPRLVALCDVSPSMRSTTRFTLMFLHSLAAEVARVRSFFFVDRVAEVTGFFRERRIGRAVARALGEADLDVGARTDYGSSLRDFDRRFAQALDKRTTLIVIGDARSNYSDPAIERLRAFRRRCRRLVFLNPESPQFWATGDSVMSRYAPLCDVVAECRTPKHLERVVDALSGRGRSPGPPLHDRLPHA